MGHRLVVLGASNVVRGFHVMVRTARRRWGDPVEVFGAFGHGRSYASASSVFGRVLPGIVDCGLWAELDRRPSAPTRAVLADVGNDIGYGSTPGSILGHIERCLQRLQARGAETVVTGLPVQSIARLSRAGFTLLRAVFFPRQRGMPLEEAVRRVRAVAEGLEDLAVRYRARFVPLQPEWYGLDPIHIRPREWSRAWESILMGSDAEPPPPPNSHAGVSAVRLYLAQPERRWLFGWEQRRRQPALTVRGGTTIWLY